MNGPPDAERRRRGDHPDTGNVLSTETSTTVQRIGPPCGCLLGGAAHLCGIRDEIPPTCARACQAATIDELRRRGATHGGCHCSPLPWVVAS